MKKVKKLFALVLIILCISNILVTKSYGETVNEIRDYFGMVVINDNYLSEIASTYLNNYKDSGDKESYNELLNVTKKLGLDLKINEVTTNLKEELQIAINTFNKTFSLDKDKNECNKKYKDLIRIYDEYSRQIGLIEDELGSHTKNVEEVIKYLNYLTAIKDSKVNIFAVSKLKYLIDNTDLLENDNISISGISNVRLKNSSNNVTKATSIRFSDTDKHKIYSFINGKVTVQKIFNTQNQDSECLYKVEVTSNDNLVKVTYENLNKIVISNNMVIQNELIGSFENEVIITFWFAGKYIDILPFLMTNSYKEREKWLNVNTEYNSVFKYDYNKLKELDISNKNKSKVLSPNSTIIINEVIENEE